MTKLTALEKHEEDQDWWAKPDNDLLVVAENWFYGTQVTKYSKWRLGTGECDLMRKNTEETDLGSCAGKTETLGET